MSCVSGSTSHQRETLLVKYVSFYSNLLRFLEECRFKCTFKNKFIFHSFADALTEVPKLSSLVIYIFGNVNVTLVEKYLSDLQTMAFLIDRQMFPIALSWWPIMQYHKDASLHTEPVNMKLNTLTSICCKHLNRIKICVSFLISVDRHTVNQALLSSKMFGDDLSPNLFS